MSTVADWSAPASGGHLKVPTTTMVLSPDVSRFPRRVALWGIVAVACIIPLWSALLGQTDLFSGDLTLGQAPWNQEFDQERTGNAPTSDFVDWQIGYQDIARDRAWDGDLAEWDELSGAGAPLMSIPHTGMYSPLAWVMWVVPPDYSAGLVKLIEFAASILGMYLLGRVIGLSTGPALVGGAAYAFSGFQILWSTSHQTLTGAMIPWLFWATERLIRRRRWGDVIALALATAAMALGGFMAVSAYALYAAAIYLVVRAVFAGLSEHGRDLLQRGEAARKFVAHHLSDALRWGSGIALGFGTIAVLILPYYAVISEDVLPEREVTQPLPQMLLTTLGFPHSYGVLNQTAWFGPNNPIEAVGYIGAAALVLALFAVVVVRWRSELSIVVVPATVTLGVFILVTYTRFPVIGAIADLPGIASSPTGRMRSVTGFLIALLAAIGAQALVSRAESLKRWERIVPVAVAGVVTIAVVRYLRNFASGRGEWDRIERWILVDVAAIAVVCILILVVARKRWSVRVAPFALVAVVCIEAMFLVVPYFPRTDKSVSMQETAAHEFLLDEMGTNDREVSHYLDLYPGTTKYFGIPSVTGHFWHPLEWKEYLEAIDPEAFRASRTVSTLDLSVEDRIYSPLLDRAAARFAVVNLSLPVWGLPGEERPLVNSSEEPVLSASLPEGEIRGFTLVFPETVIFPEDTLRGDVHIEVIGPDGEIAATSKRRYWKAIPAGESSIPLVGEDLSEDAKGLRIWLEDAETGAALDLGATSVRPVLAADDGLRLVHVSGVAIWERTTALDRYRWASDAVAEEDPSARLRLLGSGDLPPDTVVLNAPATVTSGPGTITSIDDTDPDHRTIRVDSEEGGWLVVADTMQTGWSATIDGESAELRAADHAFVAVHVPAGEHSVVFDYQAPQTAAGRAVSAVSIAGLVGIGIAARRRRDSRDQLDG